MFILKMGVNESIILNQDQNNFNEDSVRQTNQYNDKRFGNVVILRDKINPNCVYLRKFLDYDSEEEIKSIQNEIYIRKQFGDYYSQIVNSKIEKTNKLCVKDFKLEITVEYSESNLRNEIKKRSVLKGLFIKEEIFHIFKALVNFANDLDNINSFEQMLGLDNVLLHSNGRVSIIETKFILPKINLYQKILILSYEPISKDKWTILAPEQLESIKNAEKTPKFDSSKVHSFSISIIILCLISCKNEDYFYDLSQFEFLESKACKILEESDLNFETIKILKQCLLPNPSERISAAQMLKEIDLIKLKYEIDSNLNIPMDSTYF